jgi:hypothetical protein
MLRGWDLRDALWSKSKTTQGPILQWLRERGIEHRSFYIVNAILVKGSRETASRTGYLLCLSARFVGRPALPACVNRRHFIAIAHPPQDLAIAE